ncbi:MAG: helix-turn-helix domain-containing protein [Gemmatimonadaceae bacterium]
MAKTALKRPAELEHTPANCHAREMLARVGDKWSVYVIHVLDEAGTLRFNELRSAVDGISQRMLTVTLRGMERDGLVVRTAYPEVPPRVEYTLTPLGRTLRQLVRGLVAWSSAHLTEVDAARAGYDARNRRPPKVTLSRVAKQASSFRSQQRSRAVG